MSYYNNRPSRSGDDYDDDEDDKDDEKSSSPPRTSMFGNRDKPADKPGSSALTKSDPPKKDDPPRSSPLGGLGNFGRKPDDKSNPNDKDKDKKDAGSTPARPNPIGAVGGLFNRANPTPADKDKDKKDAGSTPTRPNPIGAVGGLFNRAKPDDKDNKGKEPPKEPNKSPSPYTPGSSKPPTSTSAFGSGNKPGGTSSSGSSGSGGSSGSSSGSGMFGGNKPGGSSTGSSSSGSGSSSSGSGGSGTFGSNRPAGSSTYGSGSSGSGSGSSGSGSPANRPFGSSGSGGSGSSSGSGSPGGSKPSSSSPFASKPADPKPASSSGGMFGSKAPDPKATPASSGAKPADAKPAGGGFFNRAKPPDPKPGSAAAPKAAGKDAKGDAPKINNPLTSAASTARNTLNSITGRLPFGNKPADTGKDAAKDPNRPAAPKGTFASSAPGAAGVRPGSNISSTPGKKIPAARGDKQARPLDNKPKPVVVKRAFSQDHQLDLLGIGLVILGAVIFFGLLSPGDGSITGAVVKLLGQLFGYGRIIWPIPCLAIGGWLIVRHFGDEPPVLEYMRLIGWIVMYVGFVTTLQWLELLQKPVPTLAALGRISSLAALQLRGGGWLGDKIYMLLTTALGDYATPVLLVGWWIIAIMLAFSITLAEITSYAKSIAHFFGRARNGYVERKTQAATAAALAAESAQKQPPLTVEAPAATANTPTPALADGGRQGGLFKLGLPATTKAPPPTTAVPTATPLPLAVGAAPITTEAVPGSLTAAPAPKPSPVRGLFSRGSSTPAPATASAATGTATATAAPSVAPPAARPGLFGARPAAPATGGLEPSKNPLTPGTAKPEDKAANGANGNNSDGNTGKLSSTAPVTAKPEEAAKPAPFKLFGSRGTSTASTDAAKPDDKDGKSAPTAPRSAIAGLFGSRSTPSATPDAAKAEPVKAAEPTKTSDQPAAKSATTDKSSDVKAPDTTAVKDEGKPAEAKPAAPKSPTFGLFGSRPGTTSPATTAPKDEVKADVKSDSKPNSEKPLPAAPRPVTPGLFGARPTANASSTSAAAPSEKPAVNPDRRPEEDKPATPRSSTPGLFGSRPTFSTSSAASKPAVPPVKPAVPDDIDDEDDEDEIANLPPATPKSPIGASAGLFGIRPASNPSSTPSIPAKTAALNDEDDSDDEDDEDEVANLPPATPKSPVPASASLFGARPVSTTSSKPGVPAPTPQPVKPPVNDLEDDDLDDDELEDDDEPKYIPLDDEAEPIPGRPAANRPLTPSLSGPRPAPPVAPRPFSGVGTPSTIRPSVAASSPAPIPSAAPTPERAVPIIRQPAAFSSSSSTPKPVDGDKEKPAPSLEGVILRSKGGGWELPNYTELLEKGSQQQVDQGYLMQQARIIEDTLQSFGASGKVVEINSGPVITQFGVEPDYLVSRQGKKTRVKVSSIAKLDADLALALAARSIRIEAPVPGKGFVGIEVPNSKTALVSLRDIMDSDVYRNVKSKLRIGLGQSVDGAPIAADMTAMPHLLIAGTTGSGKSVCVNAIIASLLVENTPDDLKFIMVDPKRVELTGYNGIPHLVAPVVVDLERIVGVLKWVTREMDERYKKFAQLGARNIVDYNTRMVGSSGSAVKLPYLVVVIDELADLMMLAPDETEKVLTRLAQMARATGIHLIVSTQRPSVDVVTGLIKANFPARISFAVASSVDSRVILDQPGAEKLLGRGDMLYQAPDAAAPLRMQGVYVSDSEINKITRYWKTVQTPANAESAAPPASAKNVFETPEPVQSRSEKFGGSNSSSNGSNGLNTPKLFGSEPPKSSSSPATPTEEDDGEMYEEAVKLYRENNNKISISLLQRRLRVGYMRAARLIELLKDRGVITADESAAMTANEDGKTDK